MKEKPSLRVALINFRNFFRQMVGLPKIYPVKIVRTEEAKKYQLIQISKAGDVGYNLPAIKSVTIPAPTQHQRAIYDYHMARYRRYMEINNKEQAQIHYQQALAALPKAVIPTGIKLEMPNNLWCSIEARSSSSSKMLITPDAIIDAGYRGELFAVVYNFGYEDYTVKEGEMLVQVIFHERILAEMKEVDKLSESERGEAGFGSTGAVAQVVDKR